MLSQCRVGPTLPAQDIERAKAWYKEKLDLAPVREAPSGVDYECGGGTGFTVFVSTGASRGDFTQMGFEVADVDAMAKDLSERGVEFQQYDFPGLKTDENGIADFEGDRAAWFMDSEGNLLSIYASASS